MLYLRFCGGESAPVEADPSWAADCTAAANLAPASLTAFVALAADLISTSHPVDIAAECERAGADAGLKPKASRSILRTLMLVFRGCARHHVTCPQLKDDLLRLGVDDTAAGRVAEAWEAHRADVAVALATRLLPVTAPLIHMDWRLGVTVATDDLARVGSTYVQLKLMLDVRGQLVVEHVEMTVPQFYDLLADMERAKSYMDYLGAAQA